ncbi:Gfo/Idh/MocA family oxidoreductase [Streptomyces sp. RFCAC02]|uniref:Gfo/Idh/MocA family protein n=1 Tax=Streptomyces sp. RFCAC02 TaxID=2499143 RepID=UPI001F0CDE23|nr:Gfo/Idh/MocA family oxidoreductase [Streptomyces sp. RFCAC02]
MTTRSARPRVAILGLGMIGEVHRRAALLAGAEVTGVLGRDPGRTRATADAWGVPTVYRSVEEVAAGDADIVHVCTPNATHAPYALALLAAGGKHVVCEKPLGTTVAEAEAMAEAARGTGVVTAVPFVYRYHPVVREIRARRLAGDLGTPYALHGSYLQDWLLSPGATSWRVDPAAGGASRAFADIGSHWFDLVEWVSGERVASLVADTRIAVPERPAGSVASFSGDAPADAGRVAVTTEDMALVMGRTANGVPVSATISQVAAGRKNRLWFELDGSGGSAVFDQENPESAWFGTATGAEIFLRDPGAGAAEQRRLATLPPGHAQGYAQCFESFVADTYAVVRGEEREGLPTFEDGLRAARLTEAVLRSAVERNWTEV